MKKLFPYFLLFVMLNLFQQISFAQSYEVRKFTTDDGLLDNYIETIYLDKKGFLWVKTNKGIHCYDGKKFKTFVDSSALYGLSAIIEMPDGKISIPNQKFINRYSPLKQYSLRVDTIANYKVYIKEEDRFSETNSYLDRDGYCFFYNGLHPTKKDFITVYYNEKYSKISIKNETQKGWKASFILDNTNTYWVVFKKENSEEKHFYYFKKGSLIPLGFSIKTKESDFSILKRKNKEIWIIGEENLYKIINEKLHSIKLRIVRNNPGEDKNGIVWFPSPNGLIKITNDKIEYIRDKGKRNIFCDSVSFVNVDQKTGKTIETKNYMCDERLYHHVAFDKEGNVICGDKLYNGKEFITVAALKAAVEITGILIDNENQIWYATEDGLYRCTKTPITNTNFLRGDLSFENNSILFTEKFNKKRGNLILIYKNKEITDSILLSKFQSADEEDYNGSSLSNFVKYVQVGEKIMIFTQDEIYLYNNTIEKFDLRKLVFSKNFISYKSKLPNKIIEKSIFKDEKNSVWFFYNGNYIKTDGINFTCYGREIGIPDTITRFDNSVSHFVFQKNSSLLFQSGEFKKIKNSTGNKIDLSKAKLILKSKSDDRLYFLTDSARSEKRKYCFYSLINNVPEEYILINNYNLPLNRINSESGCRYYDGNYILSAYDNGYFVLRIDDIKKTAVIKNLAIPIEYRFPSTMIEVINNKLFVFPDDGPLQVYLLNFLQKDSLGIPRLFKSWRAFYYPALITSNDKLLISNEELDSYDKLSTKTNNLVIDTKGDFFNSTEPKTNIISLTYENNGKLNEYYTNDTISEIPYKFNPLKIHYKGICLTDGSKVHYKYMLVGIDEQWQQSDEDMVTYSTLPPGKYTFKVLACNNDGLWNKQPASISFEILPPWYRTWGAYGGYIIAFFSILFGFNGVRTKQMRIRQQELEHTVTERTEEIRHQKEFIEEKQKEIIDSIAYAKRLQSAILPAVADVKALLPESFIYYQPKDIVAGDFYWMEKISRQEAGGSQYKIQMTLYLSPLPIQQDTAFRVLW